MDLARFPRRRYTHAPTPDRAASALHQGPGGELPGRRRPGDLDQARRPAGPLPRRQQDPQARVPRCRRAGPGRRHADHLRRAAVQPLPHHPLGRGQGRAEMPLRDRGARARQLQEGGQRQQLHVRADGRRGHHRGARRFGHGRRHVEGRPGSRLARPQGLRHSRRRLERDRRPGLRRLRAGNAGAVVGHGAGARCRRGRLGQLGHPWRHGGGLLRQPHQDPADRHRRQPRSGRPGAAGPQGGAGGGRPAGHRQGAARSGQELRRLLAAEVLRAQRQDGGGRADAGAHRRHPARPGLYRKDHGRPDRPRPPGPLQAQRQGAVHAHRRPAVAPRL